MLKTSTIHRGMEFLGIKILGYKYSESHSLNDSLKNNQKGSKSIAVLSKTFRMNLPVSELSSEDLRDSSLL